MEKEQRSRLQKATQDARKLLEEEFRSQLLQTYDIDVDRVRWAEEPGAHLQAEQRLIREKLIAWIEHKEAQINDRKEALLLALREMAFTALNRFVALKLMEARELVRPCVSGGLESAGFLEFTAVAQGLLADQESSYRLYLETIFEDVSRELRALFDPRDPASLLWPKRTALLELLEILNRPELAELWSEDETLGWVYQFFNRDAERKKMREESAAPRNSRELAVRNQFFTPRYVVEFLTDNTLGRIWYEMRQGDTGLKNQCGYLVTRPHEIWLKPGEEVPAEALADESLSQEELLHQPVHIPHRELKDPREIRMLDPACGSMHFGLYAFDLYLEIYTEAWEIAQALDEHSQQGLAFDPFAAYAADFADKASFLREVPRLILQHNIHGIDIDPRASQIARLTLWLRAQRAWQEQQLVVAARPLITRSNVACAEPMPGERELLAEFVDRQFPEAERSLVKQLLETIFDKMQLAGEAGSLLKIEEEIREAIDQARREWQKLAALQKDLFSHSELAFLGRVDSLFSAELQSLAKDFWVNIEERIYAALCDYAEQAESAGGFQRRLFVEDAARGFAFIDVCRKIYDVALMNPPFGLPSKPSRKSLMEAYEESWKDIYAAFCERAFGLLGHDGFLGAITPSMWQYSRQLRSFRNSLLDIGSPIVLSELGMGVMDDAAVEASIWVASRLPNMGAFHSLDLLQAPKHERAKLLLTPLSKWNTTRPNQFKAIAEGAYCHHMRPELLRLWSKKGRLRHVAEIVKGNTTFDDFRFLRLWVEIPSSQRLTHYSVYRHGGDFQPFFASSHLRIYWADEGREVRNFGAIKHGSDAQVMQSSEHWYKAGLAYPRVGTFGVRIAQAGEIFSNGSVFILPNAAEDRGILLALLNSSLALSLFEAHGRHRKTETIALKDLPVCPSDLHEVRDSLKRLSVEAAGAVREWESGDEISSMFLVPPILSAFALSEEKATGFYAIVCDRAAQISALIEHALGFQDLALPASQAINWRPSLPPEEAAIRWLSWSLGCVLGRWDIRYATGELAAPELPDPFAPLPVCPPGQLQNAQGLPARPEDVSAAYPVRIPWEGILVDDPNHPQDLESRICEVIQIIWSRKEIGLKEDAIEHEACKALGVKSLRDYFRKPAGFFAEHLKRYSKSRRQAPIYWMLSAGSCSYSTWLYYHRFTSDTLYRVLRDFVEPRIQQAERDQFELESQGTLSGVAATRLQEAQILLQDLRILKGELDLVAPLWDPDLNDGVIINHAIVWRITPYTPWQKKCKECWDKLVKGDYDWAHLAFHLWPERVIPKCTTDRSLAIAHGLEERLWQETNNGNWLPRQLSEADLQALIAEHSNPAIKSALERFLAAPPPVAPTRTRASRSTRSTGSSAPRRPRGTAAVVDAEATRQVLLALTAAPTDGLAKAAIADVLGVEANALTAVIKQLKESSLIDQLGERRGARYVLSEQGRVAVAPETEVEA